MIIEKASDPFTSQDEDNDEDEDNTKDDVVVDDGLGEDPDNPNEEE